MLCTCMNHGPIRENRFFCLKFDRIGFWDCKSFLLGTFVCGLCFEKHGRLFRNRWMISSQWLINRPVYSRISSVVVCSKVSILVLDFVLTSWKRHSQLPVTRDSTSTPQMETWDWISSSPLSWNAMIYRFVNWIVISLCSLLKFCNIEKYFCRTRETSLEYVWNSQEWPIKSSPSLPHC